MPATSPSLWTDRPDDWDAAADTPAAPTGAPAGPPPQRPRNRRPLATALAVAALAATGGGAYALGTDGADAPTAAAPAATTAAAVTPTPRTDVGKVAAAVAPSVVSVRVGSGSGTGFVYDAKGTIVTNDHVVGESTTAKIRFGDDDALVDATVVGADPSSDLAVLHVDPAKVGTTLMPLALAESKDVAVGDTAIAVGYPLGLDRTVTAGIISGLGREIEAPNGYRIDEVLQTDAPINPGNSGGPLLDGQGRVIGVNSQIATSGQSKGNLGIGFAIPSDTVKQIVPKLLAGTTIERPWLGVSTAETGSGTGATVGAVSDGSPAARAGLQAGDVVTAIDGRRIAGSDDIADAVADHQPGDRITVAVTRDGQSQSFDVTLAKRPQTTP